MAHIAGISAENAGEDVKLLYDYTRAGLAGITGREPERMLEPLEMYAHAPELLKAIAGLEQATAQLNRLDEGLNVLAQLKAATMTSCEYCIDLGSQIARRSGLSDDQLLALPAYRSSPLFSDLEKFRHQPVGHLYRCAAHTHRVVEHQLREHLDEGQLVELTHVIALENMRGRFNLGLGIGAAGFSEGMVCAVPERASEGGV